MKNNNKLSKIMYEYTEKYGNFIPEEEHQIIKHRYLIAEILSVGKNVLEVGVGQGFGFQTIAKSAKDYTGIEYSSENIKLLDINKYHIVQGDANYMPFKDAKFDIIIALAVVYYLDINKFINESKRILTKNGEIFFCTSNKDIPGFEESPHTINYFSVPELKEILNKNEFDVKFYGSFEINKIKSNNKKLYDNIKKNLKSIIKILPYGELLWIKIRNKYLGGLKKIPMEIEKIKLNKNYKENFELLDDKLINNKFRVIYCLGKRKEF